MNTAKEQVRQLLDQLPDNATLHDIHCKLNESLYSLYVREQISCGMKESREGKTTPHADIKERYSSGKGKLDKSGD